MSMQNFLSNFGEIREITIDGGTDASYGVDMANYDGVLFLILSESASLTVQARQDIALNGDLLNDPADIGAIIPSQDIGSGDTVLVDIYRPTKSYVDIKLSNDSHASNIWAIRYHGRGVPVDNSTPAAQVLLQLVSPDEV